jgi:aconitate hydratase
MGVLPLQFLKGESAEGLGLDGTEVYTIKSLSDSIKPSQTLNIVAAHADGRTKQFSVVSRLDSIIEIDYYRNGGILQYMLRKFLREEANAGV